MLQINCPGPWNFEVYPVTVLPIRIIAVSLHPHSESLSVGVRIRILVLPVLLLGGGISYEVAGIESSILHNGLNYKYLINAVGSVILLYLLVIVYTSPVPWSFLHCRFLHQRAIFTSARFEAFPYPFYMTMNVAISPNHHSHQSPFPSTLSWYHSYLQQDRWLPSPSL